jgi:hypothetical protein
MALPDDRGRCHQQCHVLPAHPASSHAMLPIEFAASGASMPARHMLRQFLLAL